MNLLNSYFRSWVSRFGSQLINVLSLAITYSLLIFMANGAFNLNAVLYNWGEDFKVNVYLKDVKDKKLSEFEAKLQNIELVENFRRVSQEEEIENISKSLNDTFIKGVDLREIVPDTYELTIKSSVDKTLNFQYKLIELVNILKMESFVEDVSYGQNWLQNYSRLISYITNFFILLCFVLLTSGLYILSTITSASISNRREEIEILEVIGATANKIRLPYVIEASVNSFLAMIIGLIINYGIFKTIQLNLKNNPMFIGLPEQLTFFNTSVLALLILLSIALAAIISFFIVKKINNGWAEATRLNG